MADYVIIAGKTVINANTDFTGRNATFSSVLTVGNTVIDQVGLTANNITTRQLLSNTATFAASVLIGNSSVNLTLSPTGLSTLGSLTVSNTTINGGLTVTGVSTLQTLNAGSLNGSGLAITNGGDAVLYLTTTAAAANTFRQKAIFSSPNVGGGTDWLFRSTRPSDGAVRDVQFTSTGSVWMTGNFDPNTKFDKTGGSITGAVSTTGSITIANSAVLGTMVHQIGGPQNTGYIEFWNTGATTREGYIGFADRNGVINLGSDRAGGYFNFLTNVPRIAGQAIWYAGNFNPANYAALNGNVTFNKVALSEGGTGNSLQVGNDVWLGDIDIANTLGVRGAQNSDRGYIRFGTPGGKFGYDSGNWTMTGGGNLYIQPGAGGSYPVWHSGNFNPGSYAALDAQARFSNIVMSGSETYIYRDNGLHNLVIRTNSGANGYKYYSFQQDGSFNVLSGSITSAGDIIATGRLVTGSGQNASYVEMRDGDEGTRFIHNNSGTIGFLGADGNWKFRVYDSGAIWTAQLGDINSRIEQRAGDYANERVRKTGDVMSGNLSIQPGSYPSVNLLYPGIKWWGMQIRENGWLYFPEDNLATFNIAFTPGGNIWSNAFGGTITDRIETRAQAWANTRQANLGFTPVQQSGGAYQSGNKIYLGWDGAAIRAQVDGSDLERILTRSWINPIVDMRLAIQGEYPSPDGRLQGGFNEFVTGTVVACLQMNSGGGIQAIRIRQVQKCDSYGNWYGIASV